MAIVARDFTAGAIHIAPISVPKSLVDSGYTPEVASQVLRDELSKFAVNIGSSMRSPNLALQSELPKITVPKVDISLDAFATLIRGFVDFGERREISGELVSVNNRVKLRLRFDGREIYSTTNAVDPTECEKLFIEAAPFIIKEIQPYLIASAKYGSDPEEAVQIADEIIGRLKESDANVQWSMILKGTYYLDHNKPAEAQTILRKVIALNGNSAAAHANLGIALQQLDRRTEAIAEYRSALKIDEKFALAHNDLGIALNESGEVNEAIDEYRRAISSDRKFAAAHVNLGNALTKRGGDGDVEDAVREYRRALMISPNDWSVHNNLGVALRDLRRYDEAIAEFRLAAETDTQFELAESNPRDAPMPVDRRFVATDSQKAMAHINLGDALMDIGKSEEALDEYERALAIDSENQTVRVKIERVKLQAAERRGIRPEGIQAVGSK